MAMFRNNNGYINQAMIDEINRDPALVAQFNAYNDDVVNTDGGGRLDSNGVTWKNPETNFSYGIVPFQFQGSSAASSPQWAQVTQNGQLMSALVFPSNLSFLNASNPQQMGVFIAGTAHEIQHYSNGISDFLAQQDLIKQLNADPTLTPEQRVEALAGLFAAQEGEGIVANYRASQFYGGLSGQGNLDVPVLSTPGAG